MSIYCFDPYLPIRFAPLLRALDVAVTHPLEHDDDALSKPPSDEDWLTLVHNSGAILVTTDRVSNKASTAKIVLQGSGITVIFLPKGFEKLDRWAQAGFLVRHWSAIDEYAATMQPGSWAQISLSGKIKPLVPQSLNKSQKARKAQANG